MSKAISAALKAHMALKTRTIARCWRLVRPDGMVLTVTNCGDNVLYAGELYLAKNGLMPQATAQDTTGAVVNTEVKGGLDAAAVSEPDLTAGAWDGSACTVFELNYMDLSMGVMLLGAFTLGNVQAGRTAFTAELRGGTQALQKTVGRSFTANCSWSFGDANCGKATGPLTVTGAATFVADLRTFTDNSRTEAADYFGAGVVTFTSGANKGLAMEVYAFTAGVFTLHLGMPYPIAIGDTYSVVPGCRLRFTEDCRIKWANGPAFGGFPYVPGPDKVMGLGGMEGNSQ